MSRLTSSKSLQRQLIFLSRNGLLLLGTLALTFILGACITFYRLSSQSLSMSSPPEPATGPHRLSSRLSPQITPKHRVAILCSPMGSTPFETLVPTAILGEHPRSISVDYISYSEETRRCRIAPGLSIIPQYALGQGTLPAFDALILPPLAASDSPALWERLMDRIRNTPRILALGESVRFAAIALGQNRMPPQLAVPYSTQKEISKSFPEAKWVRGSRVVTTHSASGKQTVISSPGLSATVDAAFALQQALGDRSESGFEIERDEPDEIPRLSIPELFQFVRWIGFQPRLFEARVLIHSGINEWGLASILEVLGKSGAVHLQYSTDGPLTVVTQNGHALQLDRSVQASAPADLLLIAPHGSTTGSATPDEAVRASLLKNLRESGVPPKNLYAIALSEAEPEVLRLLHRITGSGSEAWLSILASRLLLQAPNLNEDEPYHWAPLLTFLIFWFLLSAAAYGAVRLYLFQTNPEQKGKTARLRFQTLLFPRRRRQKGK